jgi:hypothetical protein
MATTVGPALGWGGAEQPTLARTMTAMVPARFIAD